MREVVGRREFQPVVRRQHAVPLRVGVVAGELRRHVLVSQLRAGVHRLEGEAVDVRVVEGRTHRLDGVNRHRTGRVVDRLGFEVVVGGVRVDVLRTERPLALFFEVDGAHIDAAGAVSRDDDLADFLDGRVAARGREVADLDLHGDALARAVGPDGRVGRVAVSVVEVDGGGVAVRRVVNRRRDFRRAGGVGHVVERLEVPLLGVRRDGEVVIRCAVARGRSRVVDGVDAGRGRGLGQRGAGRAPLGGVERGCVVVRITGAGELPSRGEVHVRDGVRVGVDRAVSEFVHVGRSVDRRREVDDLTVVVLVLRVVAPRYLVAVDRSVGGDCRIRCLAAVVVQAAPERRHWLCDQHGDEERPEKFALHSLVPARDGVLSVVSWPAIDSWNSRETSTSAGSSASPAAAWASHTVHSQPALMRVLQQGHGTRHPPRGGFERGAARRCFASQYASSRPRP